VNALTDRLLRRKLVQWAVTYLAAAWLLLQVLDFLAQNFAWPVLVIRAATVLLAVGFLATLVLAWYHGEKGRQRVSGAELLILTALLVLAGVLLGILRDRAGRQQEAIPPGIGETAERRAEVAAVLASVPDHSLAVLPLANVSGDSASEYFSDGITEEILNAVARVPGLKVAARTSSFAFKGRNQDIAEIAAALRVAHVLEGSLQRTNRQTRITVKLVDARTGYQLWSERYDRDAADIFAVQDEIARSVTAALRVALTGEAEPPVEAPTRNVRAHDLYLQGLFHWHQRTADDLRLALRYFREAAVEDPDYAKAHAGVALTLAILPGFARTTPETAEARKAGLRALELNADLPEAHAALGQIEQNHLRDLARARSHYERALALSPGYATAHQWMAEILLFEGRLAESRAELERAHELDPLSVIINGDLGLQRLRDGEIERAIDQLRRTVSLNPRAPLSYEFLAQALAAAGRTDETARAVEQWANGMGYSLDIIAPITTGLRAPSAKNNALSAIAQHEANGRLPSRDAAFLYALLGDMDAALSSLERAAADPAVHIDLIYGMFEPVYDPIRRHPRFLRIFETLGLEEAVSRTKR